ncbi:MAG: hypothetical protein IPK19_20780 [Chloroflexi bacterium]|nr:hypothetical protein [Chloroflexota bacterium]
MSQTMILSLIGGAASGLLSLLTVNVALRWMARRRSRGVDVESYYANMRALKRDLAQEGEPDSPESSSALRLLVLNGILLAVIMTLVLLAILSFALEPFAAVPIVLAVWLALTFAPLVVGGLRRSRRIAILEIASVLERVARSESDPGEDWAISVVKKVLGGDLFGAEEEDRLDLRLLRLEVAPIVLKVSGRVTVAEAGLGRSVNKSGMRDLRLSGWFVNELRDTEVEFSRESGA